MWRHDKVPRELLQVERQLLSACSRPGGIGGEVRASGNKTHLHKHANSLSLLHMPANSLSLSLSLSPSPSHTHVRALSHTTTSAKKAFISTSSADIDNWAHFLSPLSLQTTPKAEA